MSLSKQKIDFIFLIILGLFIVTAFYEHISYNYELSINNYAAFALWGLAILITFIQFKLKEYCVLVLIVLATFNIINFSAEVFRATIGYHDTETIYELPSVNFEILLMTVIYCMINRNFIRAIFRPSEEEENIKLESGVQFYLDKFKNVDESEWQQILSYEKDYPVEAQIAICKLKNQPK